MAILDPHVQIKLAKVFDQMWDDYLDDPSEELEAYIDASQLTDEFELTQVMHDTGDYDGNVGDLMRQLNRDGLAVIALAAEANKQEGE